MINSCEYSSLEDIQKNLSIIINYGKLNLKKSQSLNYLSEIKSSLSGFDTRLKDLPAYDKKTEFQSLVHFAKFIEETHLMMFKHPKGDDFYSTNLDCSLGNTVVALCEENNVKLDLDSSYILKCNSLEICEDNINKINKFLSKNKPKFK